jgi:membrane protein DedA with SNARE-associated domain
VPAFAAGLSGLDYRRFALFDAVALLFWSTLYVAVGGVFQSQVEVLAQSVSTHFAWVSVSVSILFVVAFAWRVQKARRHRIMHVKQAERRQQVEAAVPHAPFPLRQARG